jgi:hypothetical protein
MILLKSHWHNVMLTFVLNFLAAGSLLPLIRTQPASVHEYLNGLAGWMKITLAVFVCVVFTGAMFKLFSPRIQHLAHWRSYPPAWLAALLAWIAVAAVDLSGGLHSNGNHASAWEWLGYGGVSLLIVSWYNDVPADAIRWIRRQLQLQAEIKQSVSLQDIEQAPWAEIEAWLKSDEPANYDFIGNQSVAHRVSLLLSEGTRSIGIVGPFGAGKTSVISWVADRLKRRQVGDRKYFICHHSCWGFETSASAIQDMLGSAVSILSGEIDTFQLDSMPESYRQTFSAAGDWIDKVSSLLLPGPKVMEQFARLSKMLGDINGRLVFVVEDLDRNETSNFEIQEVLAFLERLKEYPNLSFVLTGGLSSSQRIDYPKLCDHIEFLRTIEPHQSSGLIERIVQRCLDQAVFPHIRLGDPNRNYEWNPLTGLLMRDYEELSLSQAVASLLNTPRSLRHALGRTFSAWHTLHGEINFNHLLAVNILRFAAPECFQFLMRRWDRLSSPPNKRSSFGKERIAAIRQAILDDWNCTIGKVEWNPTAALQVMEFILPATEYWLVDPSRHSSSHIPQGVGEERYWRRAVNEAIENEDVRDQEVIRDIMAWLKAAGITSELVTKLTTSPRYSDIWENLAGNFFTNPDQILRLFEQVIQRILSEQRSSASSSSQGFAHVLRLAIRRASHRHENHAWLQQRISEAATVSIKMVNGLWHDCGYPDSYSLLKFEDAESVRRHLLDAIRSNVTDGPALTARLASNSSETLYQLVFDPGTRGDRILADVQSWCWLGKCVLDAMRAKDVLAAANCGVLLGGRVSGREKMTVDIEVLDHFFGKDASEAIDILESLIDELPQADQPLVANVVGAARIHLAGGALLDEQGDDSEVE